MEPYCTQCLVFSNHYPRHGLALQDNQKKSTRNFSFMSKIHLLSTHHISGAVCVVDILCHRPALGQSPPLRRSGHVLSVHTAGHLLAIPSPEQRLGFRVASSTEVNYTWYVARDPVKFSPFPAVESDGSSKGSAPLPAGHWTRTALLLPPAEHSESFQRGSRSLWGEGARRHGQGVFMLCSLPPFMAWWKWCSTKVPTLFLLVKAWEAASSVILVKDQRQPPPPLLNHQTLS